MRSKPQRCDIRGCTTVPFVLYALTSELTKVLCRKHMLELERRGRRPKDLIPMGYKR